MEEPSDEGNHLRGSSLNPESSRVKQVVTVASEVICNGGVGAPNHRGAHVTNAECDVSNPIIRSLRYDINLSIHADVRHVGGNLLIELETGVVRYPIKFPIVPLPLCRTEGS